MLSKDFDLHAAFIKALQDRIPKKTDLADTIADILRIEKESAYRRLTGRVNFSLREAGIIAKEFGLSIDELFYQGEERVWMPIEFRHPLMVGSMDILFDAIEAQLDLFTHVVQDGKSPVSMGCIYSTLPPQFYLYSPQLTKFMFFRWGYYFLRTDEFANYSSWRLPEKVSNILPRLKELFTLDSSFYIWDESIIRTLAKEVKDMRRMNILTDLEKLEIKNCLKDLLDKLEQTLNTNYMPTVGIAPEAEFYVCPVHLGFTCYYLESAQRYHLTFYTNFTFSVVDSNYDTTSLQKLKQWVDSFRKISTRLSRGGRTERRMFFAEQHDILNRILL